MFRSIIRLRRQPGWIRWAAIVALIIGRAVTESLWISGSLSIFWGLLLTLGSALVICGPGAVIVVALSSAVPGMISLFWGGVPLQEMWFFVVRFASAVVLVKMIGSLVDRADFLALVGDYIRERVVLVNRQGRVVYISRTSARQYEREPEELEGKQLTSFVAEWFRPVAQEMLDEVMRGKTGVQTPIFVVSRGGEMVPVVVKAEPLVFKGETYCLGVLQDVAGPELTQRLFASSFDAMEHAMAIRSPDGGIIWCNRRFAEVARCTKAELIGQKVTPFRADQVDLAALMDRLRNGQSEHHELALPDGRVTEWHAYPILNADGTLLASISLAADVTERKQAEARVLQAERMAAVGQLSAGIAHNFNNVLAAISANAELMRMQGDEVAAKAAENILVAVEHGSSMVNKLYELGGRRAEPKIEDICVMDLFASVTQVVDAQARQSCVSIATEGPTELTVRADAGQMKQVLLNLVLNSLQAMPLGGKLTLASRVAWAGAVELSVADTGCGIPPEHLDRIFTPFFTTKGSMNGTGLGLPTSLAMVRAMGGTLDVASEPGVGTTMSIRLPHGAQAA